MKLIECPRDAMQGLHDFVPTELKIAYINLLLKCGFDTIDFGSFVSAKAIPQLRDTKEVLAGLELTNDTKLLAIVANVRGAEEAAQHEEITYLGFPFSVSETFQQRNTNSSILDSLKNVEQIQDICSKKNKKAVVYLSMGFGNPYGDPWNAEIVAQWADKLHQLDVKILSLADTVGVSNPENITYLFTSLNATYPSIEWGVHLHSHPYNWEEKINAAWQAGCRRFDAALKGYGGCPMANDDLVGNIATENILHYLADKNITTGINEAAFKEAMNFSSKIFL